ncbi:MAG TPA: pyrimidine utilization protein C [Stellaceae bacterium]|nr:pyrimidine utilization protein C [Stellaceae bacterium]
MTGIPVIPKGAAPPLAPYSPGIKADGVVYVSGTLALDANGNIVAPGEIVAQTRHVLEAIKAVLQAAGGDMSDIAYNMIFLKNAKDYAEMNKVYAEYFPTNPPARFCIITELVKPEFVVEISSIAHMRTAR